jgi:predicted site-specific integrase-resolvase
MIRKKIQERQENKGVKMKKKKIYTAKEVSKITGVSISQLYQWVHYGLVKSVATYHCLFFPEDLEKIKKLKKEMEKMKNERHNSNSK